MIDKREILEGIKLYIGNASNLQKEDIHNDTLIFENSLLDSMGFLFLIDFLKEKYGVEVEDNDLLESNFKSINNIADFLQEKLRAKALSAELFI